MLNFVEKRYWYFLLSALILVPGIISLLIPPRLQPGIEFTSGTVMTIQFDQTVEQGVLREEFRELGHGDSIIQKTGEGAYLVRTRVLKGEEKDREGNVIAPAERQQIMDALDGAFGSVTLLSFDAVSPIVAAEIIRNATLAVLAASVGILLYISWAFRSVPNPFRYGICAIVALLHDAFLVLGIFSLMGKFLGTEIDSMFISAILTVIGFSVHDTIVVFDRIRENIRRYPNRDFATNVNNSLIQTLGRSLNTSLSVIFTLVAILLFGGVTIRNFVLALTIGIITGTYSSIFIASQLLVVWEYGELGNLLRRFRSREEAVVESRG